MKLGFAEVLTIVFVVLKLLGKIAWSWWWVFSPVLVAWSLALAALGVMGIAALFLAKDRY